MKKIMFCGGGSAGHVMPNIAIYEVINNKCEACYIGTDSIEKNICKDFGLPFYQFDGVKLVRGKLLRNLTIPSKLKKSVAQCKNILIKQKPDLLFCKGGYAALPPALAARKLGIPILTHESDLTAGLANRIIARRAERILTSFPSLSDKFKNGVWTGSPMRESIFSRNKMQSRQALQLDLRPTVLVFGGGSGSQKINENLRKSLLNICKKYNVMHVCGKGNLVENNIYGYRQIEFSTDMGLLYACADYAVARCGSNSAFELISLKIPTLFIPLDNGTSRGDQVQNAEYFRKLGLCHVLKEADLNAETLEESIDGLIHDEQLKNALRLSNIECGNKNILIEIDRILKN